MWRSALSYAMSSSNYSVMNMNNIYNFLVSIMDNNTEEQNQHMIDSLILHLGRTFYRDFRQYLIIKLPGSKHVPLINRIV
jgi:hypothetical protein